jgi:hypothetical protein
VTPEQTYLQDVLETIIERAKDASRSSKSADSKRTAEQQAFEDGRALAYYEVVSTLVNQADVFGLSPDVLPVLRFDPDKELL